jgi:hypothetical protein
MTASLAPPELEAPALTAEAPTTSDRWSGRVFVAAVVVTLPLLLWVGRDHWFFLDEWWVLTRDGLTRPGYLDGHNGHWITLLRFEYRLNFELWGLRSYVPYQLPVVLAHLGAAVLLRQVIRRCGARGWTATVVALAFLFFGSGRENMTFGFQASVTGSLVCGLGLFLLADGPRTVTRRDWLALGLGVVGLMTSSVFVALLVGFGVATLLRRGLRVAVFYALPLGLIYGAWYIRYGADSAVPLGSPAKAARFVGRMFWAIFDALAQSAVGAVLVVLAGVGLAAALHRARRSGNWAHAALPLGLAAAWLTFASLTALGRADVELTAESHGAGRYVHVGAVLLLPLVAVGAERLARRHTALAVMALAPLAIGLPGNLDLLYHTDPLFRTRDPVLALAHSRFIDDVPPDTRLIEISEIRVPLTAGWLGHQVAAGRVPEPDDAVDPVVGLDATRELVLEQRPGTDQQRRCPPLTGPLATTLHAGGELRFGGAIRISTIDGTDESSPRGFFSGDGSTIRALAGPVDILVRSVEGLPGFVCEPPDPSNDTG